MLQAWRKIVRIKVELLWFGVEGEKGKGGRRGEGKGRKGKGGGAVNHHNRKVANTFRAHWN